MAFVKLDVGILDSTLWMDRESREVFITALLMAEPKEYSEPVRQLKVRAIEETGFEAPPGWYGLVPAAGPGIVHRAGIEQEAGLCALEKLGSPDLGSRSSAFDGRRMIRVDGGYLMLNYIAYRDKDHTTAERSRRYRERKAMLKVTRDAVAVTRDMPVTGRDITHAYENADASSQSISTDDQLIYAEYPRKVGRTAALKAIKLALKSKERDFLIERTRAYADATKAWSPADQQFIPHPATWFNRGSYDDDPATWTRTSLPSDKSAAVGQSRFRIET